MMNKIIRCLLFANYCLANRWATKKRIHESTVFLFSTQICYLLSGIYFGAIGCFTVGIPKVVMNGSVFVIVYLSFYWKKRYLEKIVTAPEMKKNYLSIQAKERNKISLFSFIFLLSSSIFFIIITIIFFSKYYNNDS